MENKSEIRKTVVNFLLLKPFVTDSRTHYILIYRDIRISIRNDVYFIDDIWINDECYKCDKETYELIRKYVGERRPSLEQVNKKIEVYLRKNKLENLNS
jgi:hypothetical protein